MHNTAITTVYLIVAISTLALAAWGYAGYKKNASPFTKYLAMIGLFAGMYFLFNSIPFILSVNIDTLKISVNIGDIFYYSMILTQLRMIWYLGFYQRFNYMYVFIPTFVITVGVYLNYVYNIWHTTVTLGDGVLSYNWPTWALRFDALLGSLMIISGVYVLRLFKAATSFKGRVRIGAIGLAFIAGGLDAVYNTLFLRGLNNSGLILISYVVVFGILFVVSLIGRIQTT